MWRLLKFLGFLLKTLLWLLLAAALVGLLALYMMGRNIPAPILDYLASNLPGESVYWRIERATFTPQRGLRLHGIKALPKKIASDALIKVDELELELSLRPQLPMHERIKGVRLKNISMPDLPPARSELDKKPPSLTSLPDMVPFPLVVRGADILGIKVKSLECTATVESDRVLVSDIVIKWADASPPMEVKGHVTLDLNQRLIRAHVDGEALPDNILPLLKTLRARGAIRQVECFTEVRKPVKADFTIVAEMDKGDFDFTLGLDVGPCRYRGVPVEHALGTIHACETNRDARVFIDIRSAKSASGPIKGQLVYKSRTEGLEVVEATTRMEAYHLLNMLNILNRGELDRIQFHSPVNVTASGLVALSSTLSTVTNALQGRIILDQATILNLPLHGLAGDLTLSGYSATISNASGVSDCGGKVDGVVAFHFPEYMATSTTFEVEAKLDKVGLENLSQAFNVTNARAGLVSGTISVSGPTSGKTMPRLNGAGSVRIVEGVLHRMKVFAGFTDYLARNIPGVSAMVNQSEGSMDFTITNGVLHTRNLLVEGNLFSMRGGGTYNLMSDELDFTVRANIFRQHTWAGRLTRLLTLPFSRMLLEFKVFGPLDNPDWSYVSIIERITDTLAEKPEGGTKEN